MKNSIFCFLFFWNLVFPGGCYRALGQNGHPGITNYRSQDYNMHNQNWAAMASPSGSMLFGNTTGVLEFDGVNWSSYILPFNGRTTALSGDDKHGIHYGSDDDFGEIVLNEKTKTYEFISFMKLRPDLVKNCGTIWNIFHNGNETYYCSAKSVFRVSGRSISAIDAPKGYQLRKFFTIRDQVICRVDGMGLCRLDKDKFTLLPGGDVFAETGVDLIYELNPTTYLIGTRTNGLFIADSDKLFSEIKVSPLRTDASNLLIKEQLTCFLPLPNGNIACGTHGSGVVILNQKGITLEIIDRGSGLQDNSIRKLALDHQGNLWAALDKGICMIELQYPFRKTDANEGLEENVNVIQSIDDFLLIGTTKGLFGVKQDSKSKPVHIGEIDDNIRSITQASRKDGDAGRFLVLTEGSVYSVIYKNGVATSQYEGENPGWSSLAFHSGLNKIIACGTNMIAILDHTQRSIPEVFSDTIDGMQNPGTIEIDERSGLVFISEKNKGIFVTAPAKTENGFRITVKQFYTLPFKKNLEYPICIKGNFLYCGMENSIKEINITTTGLTKSRLIPLSSNKQINGSTVVFQIKNLGPKGLFICGDTEPSDGAIELVRFASIIPQDMRMVKSISISNNLFKRSFQNQINDCVTHGESLFLASNEGLIKLEPNVQDWPPARLFVRLSQLTLNSDSVIFKFGFKQIYRDTSYQTLYLSYGFSSLKIEFRTNHLGDNKEIRYRTFLDGSDQTWSKWSVSPQREFSGLYEGSYVFRIQAMLQDGTISNTLTQKIQVATPWYRSSPAYLGYISLLFLVVIGSVRYNTRRLKALNELLEKTVRSRTKELHLEKQNVEKKNIEITDSINYARVIQQSILPSKNTLKEAFGDLFLFYKPRDIVSGDFYWVFNGSNQPRFNESNFIAVADCTGHGVPGAFMSMIGMEKLNQAIRELPEVNPSSILSFLNTEIKNTLKQHGSEFQSNDGMEISLVSLHQPSGILNYAGANRPLWIFKESGDLEIIKPTKAGIAGSTSDDQVFECHQVQLEKGDTVYLFSDGIVDQFGGDNGKKLTSKGLRNLIASLHTLPLQEQKERIRKYLEEWMSREEQIDDILMLGFRI